MLNKYLDLLQHATEAMTSGGICGKICNTYE